MEKSCETCKHAKFVIGFEQDPICLIRAGVICNEEKFKAWEKREGRLIVHKGGLLAMLEPLSDLGDVYINGDLLKKEV